MVKISCSENLAQISQGSFLKIIHTESHFIILCIQRTQQNRTYQTCVISQYILPPLNLMNEIYNISINILPLTITRKMYLYACHLSPTFNISNQNFFNTFNFHFIWFLFSFHSFWSELLYYLFYLFLYFCQLFRNYLSL